MELVRNSLKSSQMKKSEDSRSMDENNSPDPIIADRYKLHILCKSCQEFVRKSPALFNPLLTEASAKYQVHDCLRSLKISMEAGCHLCILVWYKISEPKIPQFDIYPILLQATNGLVPDVTIFWAAPRDNFPRSPFHMRSHLALKRGDFCAVHPTSSFTRTSSVAHMDLARYWLEECTNKHLTCNNYSGKSRKLPARLVQIDPSDESNVKLYFTSVQDAGIRYCTLSHCWGGVTDILQLTKNNISIFQSSIEVHDLPKTFRDAIYITRQLGLKFLWIDSLCIIQDSDDDWNTEAANMGSIYENSILTIAAAAGPNPYCGCFVERNPFKNYFCRIAGEVTVRLYSDWGSVVDFRDRDVEVLNSRAWVMQERVLSPRTLYFTERGMLWNCFRGKATEVHQNGWLTIVTDDKFRFDSPSNLFGPSTNKLNIATSIYPETPFGRLLLHAHDNQSQSASMLQKFSFLWYEVVKEYSALKITYSSDRLVALSAIAQRIGKAFGFDYVAGLWKQSLLWDLLWVTKKYKITYSATYNAPTWSWASTEGGVSLHDEKHVRLALFLGPGKALAEIISAEVSCHAADAQRTGQISDGSLTLLGVLKVAPELDYAKSRIKGYLNILDDDEAVYSLFLDFEASPYEMAETFFLPLFRYVYDTEEAPFWVRNLLCGLILSKSPGQDFYHRVGIFYSIIDRIIDNEKWINDFHEIPKQVVVIK